MLPGLPEADTKKPHCGSLENPGAKKGKEERFLWSCTGRLKEPCLKIRVQVEDGRTYAALSGLARTPAVANMGICGAKKATETLEMSLMLGQRLTQVTPPVPSFIVRDRRTGHHHRRSPSPLCETCPMMPQGDVWNFSRQMYLYANMGVGS